MHKEYIYVRTSMSDTQNRYRLESCIMTHGTTAMGSQDICDPLKGRGPVDLMQEDRREHGDDEGPTCTPCMSAPISVGRWALASTARR